MLRGVAAVAALVFCVSCTDDGGPGAAAPSRADAGTGSEAGVALTKCSLDTPFGAPERVAGLSSNAYEGSAVLSKDELEIFFDVYDESTKGAESQLYTAKRASIDEPFGPRERLSLNDANANNYGASLGDDDVTIVFASDRSGTPALYRATRPSKSGAFGPPSELTTLAVPGDSAYLTPGNAGLWLTARDASGKLDIYYANASGGGFEAARRVDELDTDVTDTGPVPTADGLALYFGSSRLDTAKGYKLDVYLARRASPTAKFDAPKLVAELNGATDNWPSFISRDDCRLYFTRNDGGNYEVYVAKRSR